MANIAHIKVKRIVMLIAAVAFGLWAYGQPEMQPDREAEHLADNAHAGFTQTHSSPPAEDKYLLHIQFADSLSPTERNALQLKTSFDNLPQCQIYVSQLPNLLRLKGYLAASVDEARYDSNAAYIQLYVGRRYQLVNLTTDSIDKKALDETGTLIQPLLNQPVDFVKLQQIKERLLGYYENNGYPFAGVLLNDIQIDSSTVKAVLKLSRGPLYKIDSIRMFGKVKIANHFLQRYLGITNGSLYNRQKLNDVSRRLLELPYVQEQQPADVSLLGTGAVLNLYLKPKKSSQVNFLIGFLPANNQTNKLQITGDVNLNLKNPFGNGETVLINWQQLQLQSPRLIIGYQHPYIFKSAFGLDFNFELFKKDSTFIQLNASIGAQYLLNAHQQGKLFIAQQSTILQGGGADTGRIRLTKQLPPNIDVKATSVGIDYEWNKTNYRFNPRSGTEVKITASTGLKTISKNTDILSMNNGDFDYASLYDSIKLKTYQFRVKLNAAHYFASGKRSTLKLMANAGVFASENIFRNELFQIGGFRLLRGFDEESIFATRYGIATAEFRYLAGLNSYLFYFIDAGWVQNKYEGFNQKNQFLSTGIGMLFETKAGLLNLSFAIGKRDDVPFDLRRSAKIHFGYINYF